MHRDLFANALALIYSRPMVQTSLPSAGRVSLMHQPQQRRYVAHLLYGAPLQRGRCLVIEDLPALVRCAADRARAADRQQQPISSPDARRSSMTREDGAVSVTVPRVQGHQAVVFEV